LEERGWNVIHPFLLLNQEECDISDISVRDVTKENRENGSIVWTRSSPPVDKTSVGTQKHNEPLVSKSNIKETITNHYTPFL
jgi:hypothetical protein